MERPVSSSRDASRLNSGRESEPVGPSKYSPNYKYFQKKTRNAFMDRKAKLRDSYGDVNEVVSR